jgi:porin
MANPGDRNLVSWYVDAGIDLKGMIPARDADVWGVGFAFANIGDAARGFDEDLNRFSGANHPVRDYESVVEVTYLAPLTPWLSLQPDFQYVMHPGGNSANPSEIGGVIPIKDAAVIGVRMAVKF